MSMANNIVVITDPSQILRVRPHSYIEDVSCNGFHELLMNFMERAVNPITGNNASECRISINEDGVFEFRDNGDGLNISSENLCDAITALTTLMAGKPPETAEEYSGVFFCFNLSPLLIATTSYFYLSTIHDGHQYEMTYLKGCVHKPLQEVVYSGGRGTMIRLLPDTDIWGQCEIDMSLALQRINDLIKQLDVNISVDYEETP